MDEPRNDRPDETPQPLRAGPLVGGAVVGFLVSWVGFAVVAIAMYSTFGDSSSGAQTAAALAGLLVLPVVATALMVPRRTRRAGAGFLMGIAIGAIAGAGVCGAGIGLSAG